MLRKKLILKAVLVTTMVLTVSCNAVDEIQEVYTESDQVNAITTMSTFTVVVSVRAIIGDTEIHIGENLNVANLNLSMEGATAVTIFF